MNRDVPETSLGHSGRNDTSLYSVPVVRMKDRAYECSFSAVSLTYQTEF